MATNLVDAARAYLGQQYVWGGESKEEGGFDCSGLVYAALRDAGFQVPRGTAATYATSLGTPVGMNDLQPGDLIFYANTGSRKGVTHIAIYAGNGYIIDASSSKNAVVYRPMWGNPVSARRLTGMPPSQSAGELTQLAGLSEREQRDLRRLNQLGINGPEDLGILGKAAQGIKTGSQATTGSQPTDKLPPNANPAEVEAYVREHYPGAAYLLTVDDAVHMLVVHAAQEGWSDERLKGEIQKTDWYKRTSETERSWRELSETDPATAGIRRDQTRANVSQQAARMGAVLTPAQLDMVVEGSLRFGWTQQQLTATLAGFAGGEKPVGDSRTILQNLRAQAADYAVPVDQKTLQFWTDKILRGEQDEDDFTGYLRGQAIGLFRGNDAVTKQIESGFNVRQIAAGALGWAARELDIADTSTIDLSDPKWLRLIHHQDEKGTFGPMSGADVIATVRSDPVYGYDRTMSGRSRAVELSNAIGETFGTAA